MIKNKFLPLAILTLFFCINSFAQNDVKNYDWEKDGNLLQVPSKHAKSPEVVLKEKTVVAFDYGDKNSLEEYFVNHTIVNVNSDDAIEANNKIYLPVRSTVDVIKQKARVITPTGEVIEMKESDIKEAKQEKGTYRYFALRGLVKGSQVESFFVLRKKRPHFEGRMIEIQDELPKYNVSFDLIAPENLTFRTKTYNGLRELDLIESDVEVEKKEITDEDVMVKVKDKKFHLSQTWNFIEPLKPEENANYLPNIKKLIYCIDKNLLKPRTDIISYDNIAKSIYESIDITPEKKLAKKLKKYLKANGLKNLKSEEEKLFALENHLKVNFPVKDGFEKELEDIESILKNKVASKRGIIKLYCAFLNYMKVDHQIVFTNNRSEHSFDETFQAYNFLENYLLYFPKLEKFMSPTQPFTKLGIIPSGWTNNYGLFVEPVEVGSFKTAKGTIKFIEANPYSDSRDDMLVNVSSDDNFKSLKMTYNKIATGYYAQNWQPLYDFVDEKSKKEVNEAQIKFLTEDLNIEKIEIENEGLANFGMKPFKLNSEFTTKAFIERAGNKTLLKIGEMIGPQVEMYQEEKRKLPVDNPFNRHYHREITLNVPNGYEVGNLDALNFDKVYKEDGKIQAQFVSNYTYKDNVLKVVVDEYYDKIQWEVKLFEEYRTIINAAADFNKVVLYLEK